MFLSADQRKEDEKARLLGVSNLFKLEISAKMSPVLDRYSSKKERGRRELKGNLERDWGVGNILEREETLTRRGNEGDNEIGILSAQVMLGWLTRMGADPS